MDGALGLEKSQAIFVERNADIIEQAPHLPLEILDEVVVDQAVDAAGQNLIEVTHRRDIIGIDIAPSRPD